MAGWSMLANGTGLDSDIANHKQKGILQTNDVDVVNRCDDDDDVELRSLFDQALSVLRVKPVQASVGNGETVDLFKLFCVVGERGGFDLVDGFWNFVAKELGLDPVLSGSVKLVYFRYLYSMEMWLIRSFSDEQLGHHSERKRKGSDFSRDLETKLRGLLGDGKTGEERGDTFGLDSGKCELGLLGKMNPCRPANGFHIMNNDDDDENINGGCGNYGDIAVDQEMTQNDLGEKKSRKRKRISVSKLLRWIRQAAVCPIDHAAVSTSYDKRGNDLKALAIRARDFLVGETGFDLNVGQRSSKVRCISMNLQYILLSSVNHLPYSRLLLNLRMCFVSFLFLGLEIND
ncbi:AT-rich interactive domain-containing protein 2 [Linum perenne]